MATTRRLRSKSTRSKTKPSAQKPKAVAKPKTKSLSDSDRAVLVNKLGMQPKRAGDAKIMQELGKLAHKTRLYTGMGITKEEFHAFGIMV